MSKKIKIVIGLIAILSIYGCSKKEASHNESKHVIEPSITSTSTENNKYENILAVAKEKGKETIKDYESKEQIDTTAFMEDEVITVEDVEQVTELAITGVVVDSEPFIFKNAGIGEPYTKVTVYVDEVLEGDPTLKDTEIIIYEAGGIISKKDLGMDKKFPNQSKSYFDTKVVVNFDGVRNSIPGTEIAGFLVKLEKSELGVEKDFYQFFGNYQTRFDKNEDSETYEVVEPISGGEIERTITEKEKENLSAEITEFVDKNSTN